MSRNTFISYKYSEAQSLRDDILTKLGDDAKYYRGETADSPDLTDTSTNNIKENLKNMMYATSVTIVVISPNMIQSNWIDWEIGYTLKAMKRGDRRSNTNGIVGVIMKVNGSYDWMISVNTNTDGCSTRTMDTSKMYDIINSNRFNKKGDDRYSCSTCKSFDALEGSYFSLIKEDEFLSNPQKYIENAYDKSQRLGDFEDLVKSTKKHGLIL